jgi:hypothetical protein
MRGGGNQRIILGIEVFPKRCDKKGTSQQHIYVLCLPIGWNRMVLCEYDASVSKADLPFHFADSSPVTEHTVRQATFPSYGRKMLVYRKVLRLSGISPSCLQPHYQIYHLHHYTHSIAGVKQEEKKWHVRHSQNLYWQASIWESEIRHTFEEASSIRTWMSDFSSAMYPYYDHEHRTGN